MARPEIRSRPRGTLPARCWGERGQRPPVAPLDTPRALPAPCAPLRASAAAAERAAALPPQRRGQDAVARASRDAGSAPLAVPLLRWLRGESPTAAQAPAAEPVLRLRGKGPCGGRRHPLPGAAGSATAAAPLSSSCSFLRRLFLARPLGSIRLCPLSLRAPPSPRW